MQQQITFLAYPISPSNSTSAPIAFGVDQDKINNLDFLLELNHYLSIKLIIIAPDEKTPEELRKLPQFSNLNTLGIIQKSSSLATYSLTDLRFMSRTWNAGVTNLPVINSAIPFMPHLKILKFIDCKPDQTATRNNQVTCYHNANRTNTIKALLPSLKEICCRIIVFLLIGASE